MEKKRLRILLYTSYLHSIGGIETFVINFCCLLRGHYDVAVYCPKLPGEIEKRLRYQCATIYTDKKDISCDILIMVRMSEEIPNNIKYKRSIRMCHAEKSTETPDLTILDDCDEVVHVSEASRRSFNSDGEVILNPVYRQSSKDALLLVSATRIPARDKGDNARRMLQLAKMLEKKKIPFIWLNFSDAPLNNAPKGFINMGTFQDIGPYMRRADYLVQLSDHEGFCYSVAEALTDGVPVICTPFETTKELGVVDGENGYIVPFDMKFDVRKLLDVPNAHAVYADHEYIRARWKALFDKALGVEETKAVKVKCLQTFNDLKLKRQIKQGEEIYMERNRAKKAQELGLVEERDE